LSRRSITRRAAAAGAVLAALLPLWSARGQGVEATARAHLELPARVYANEVFDFVVRFDTFGVPAVRDIQYVAGAESGALVMDEFRELPERRSVRGTLLSVERTYRCRARAPATGTIRVNPSLRVSLVDGFFVQVRELTMEPREIAVLAVPAAGRPSDWSGAIGTFEFEAEVVPRELAPGDLATLRVTLRGRGYREGIRAPSVSPGAAFRVYEARLARDEGDAAIYEQTVIPLSTNAAAVPAVAFTYFDPAAGAYRTARAGPFALRFRSQVRVEQERYRSRLGTEAEDARAAPSAAAGVNWGRLRHAAAVAAWPGAFLAAAGAAAQWRRRRRAAAAGLCAAAAAILLAPAALARLTDAAAGGAVTSAAVVARVAPGAGAMVLFDVPAGAPVTPGARQAGWVCVRRGEDSGWIPVAALDSNRKDGDLPQRPPAAP
jgi:hypothetical protein